MNDVQEEIDKGSSGNGTRLATEGQAGTRAGQKVDGPKRVSKTDTRSETTMAQARCEAMVLQTGGDEVRLSNSINALRFAGRT